MTRVPTWAELRIDVNKLIHTQKECYRSVHDMLDRAIPEIDRKLSIINGSSDAVPTQAKPSVQPSLPPPFQSAAQFKVIRMEKPDLDELVHLRPLPMPLGYYWMKNRPDLMRSAERRIMYLKKKAERRKLMSTSKTFSALDLLRSSSRSSLQRKASSLRSSLRTVSRDTSTPNYNVKCKLSEREMRQLTARTYNRLPEVKRQRNEQVTKHMKVQNYKNKMEYGRKLLENRRQGIINYPLRNNYDDSSVMSSQEESFTNSLDQSLEAQRYDQY